MTSSLRTYDMIGHRTEGNFILRELQYNYNDLDVAKNIVYDKIYNQKETLCFQRAKDNDLKNDIGLLETYLSDVLAYDGDYRGLMGIEGNAAKIFFRSNFNMIDWRVGYRK